MNLGKLSVLVVLLLTAALGSGCTTHSYQPLATQAVNFNLTVEQAQNEMLLLNVIRAKDRLPMYLTAISSLNGNLSTSVEAGLGGSYSAVKDAKKVITRGLTPSIKGSVARNPNFTLAVLDGEKFTRGFLKPIDKRIVAYLWDQGWPPELLLYLLVQRVETKEGGGDLDVTRNYPPDRAQFEKFGRWVTEFLAEGPTLVTAKVSDDIGPPLVGATAETLGDLVAAVKEGLVVTDVQDPNRPIRLRRSRVEYCFNRDGGKDCRDPQGERRAPKDDGAQTAEQTAGTLRSYGGAATTIVLRSPEGILYYLGELMRVANRQDDPYVPHVCIQGRSEPLFVALPEGKCDDAFVRARSAWGDWMIPKSTRRGGACQGGDGTLALTTPTTQTAVPCDPGRSMQAFRLLSQLISLQKSAEELPSPALVRVIGE